MQVAARVRELEVTVASCESDGRTWIHIFSNIHFGISLQSGEDADSKLRKNWRKCEPAELKRLSNPLFAGH